MRALVVVAHGKIVAEQYRSPFTKASYTLLCRALACAHFSIERKPGNTAGP